MYVRYVVYTFFSIYSIHIPLRGTHVLQAGPKWKNSAIENCWIGERGAMKLHPFGTSAERIKTCVLKGYNFIAPQALTYPANVLLVFYFIA